MTEATTVDILFNTLTPYLGSLGTGGVLGGLVGYATKKAMKIIAVILGLFSAGLVYLSYQGIIRVDFKRTEEMIMNGTNYAANVMVEMANHVNSQLGGNTVIISGAGGFAGGFLLGFSRG